VRIQLKDHLDRMKKHKAQKEREEGDFQYSGSDDEAQPEADERAGEPSSILQVAVPYTFLILPVLVRCVICP